MRNHLVLKTIVVSFVVMATNVFGNYALKLGLSSGAGAVLGWAPMPYLRALAQPWVIAGVLLMLGWFISRLMLLSWADLSYVLPVTAFSYVLSALLGATLLREKVASLHWAGIFLITLGTGFTIFTRPGTTPSGDMAK
ncbi:MAG TPA: EamA family transporter [Terriglobales bacterium]|nr:EamA family transporter [Terriglobales bacterium]